MRLEEACNRFNELAGIRFGDLFSPADMEMIIINKGKTGQLLELSLGMHLSSTNLDFEDGELKTNKCDAAGNPREKRTARCAWRTAPALRGKAARWK